MQATKAFLLVAGTLLTVSNSGCHPPYQASHKKMYAASYKGQDVNLIDVTHDPIDGQGGDGGCIIHIGGIDPGTGLPVRVIVTDDPNGNGVLDPNEETWVETSDPPPATPQEHSDDPNNPPPHPITDEIRLGPGNHSVVVVVEYEENGHIVKKRIVIDVKKGSKKPRD